jgi:hypothetical protein
VEVCLVLWDVGFTYSLELPRILNMLINTVMPYYNEVGHACLELLSVIVKGSGGVALQHTGTLTVHLTIRAGPPGHKYRDCARTIPELGSWYLGMLRARSPALDLCLGSMDFGMSGALGPQVTVVFGSVARGLWRSACARSCVVCDVLQWFATLSLYIPHELPCTSFCMHLGGSP